MDVDRAPHIDCLEPLSADVFAEHLGEDLEDRHREELARSEFAEAGSHGNEDGCCAEIGLDEVGDVNLHPSYEGVSLLYHAVLES